MLQFVYKLHVFQENLGIEVCHYSRYLTMLITIIKNFQKSLILFYFHAKDV